MSNIEENKEFVEKPLIRNYIYSNYNKQQEIEEQVEKLKEIKTEIFKKEFREFVTGAIRDTNVDKIRPDLISPYMLKALGKVLAEGAKHYGEKNWEKGIPNEVLKESAARHYVSWMNNEDNEDHAAKLIFNVMAWIHFRDKKDE